MNEIQLAKAAICTGIKILLEVASIRAIDVQAWVSAGAFGIYINLESAVRVGLSSPATIERFCKVGNAAYMGARQALLSL